MHGMNIKPLRSVNSAYVLHNNYDPAFLTLNKSSAVITVLFHSQRWILPS
jgi:hypothetical protein